MNKKIPLWLVLLLLWFSGIVTILFGWAVWHIENNGPLLRGKASNAIIFVASFPSLARETFEQINKQSVFIRPNLYPRVHGFKAEQNYIDSNYILVPTYDKKLDQFIVKLIRIYDQKIIHRWVPDFDKIKKVMLKQNKLWDDANRDNTDISHPLLLADGSIIFHYFNSPIVKVDKNSKVIWILNGSFHHSIEFDADGNIWSPSIIRPSTFLPHLLPDYQDEALTKISPDGKVLFTKSVAQILTENGYTALLLGVGSYEKELLHLNDIQPALTSSKYWDRGDLLISIRNRSTVFLYRPSTNKILWLKTGPWINEHDCDFIDSTRIGVFGNDVVRIGLENRLLDGHNEEFLFDFRTNKVETPYAEFFKKAKISTPTGGRSELLPNGDIFVEETENNRLLRGNTKDIIWQFTNRNDESTVGALSWSRFITKDEFKKLAFLQKSNTL